MSMLMVSQGLNSFSASFALLLFKYLLKPLCLVSHFLFLFHYVVVLLGFDSYKGSFFFFLCYIFPSLFRDSGFQNMFYLAPSCSSACFPKANLFDNKFLLCSSIFKYNFLLACSLPSTSQLSPRHPKKEWLKIVLPKIECTSIELQPLLICSRVFTFLPPSAKDRFL